MIWLLALSGILGIFIPSIAKADFTNSLGSNTLWQNNDSTFVIRSNNLVQKANIQSSKPVKTVVFKDNIFLITQTNQVNNILTSTDGLNYQALDGIVDPVDIKSLKDYLVISTKNNLYISKDGDNFIVKNSDQDNLNLSNIIEENNLLEWLETADNTVIQHIYDGKIWLEADLPLLTIKNDDIFVGLGKNNQDLYIVEKDNLINIKISGEVSDFKVIHHRILVQIDNSWYEVLWKSDASLMKVSDGQSSFIPIDNSNGFLIINETKSYLTMDDGVLVPADLSQNILKAQLNNQKIIAWGNSPTIYNISLNGEISQNNITTSKYVLDNLFLNNNIALASFYSSTGISYLYRADPSDLSKWSSVSIPKSITYASTIDSIRELPAGTLVQIRGVVSVQTGVVANNILYIEDETGGIQIYLSTTFDIAKLNNYLGHQITVSGEISTSQVKRISVSKDSVFEIGGYQDLSSPEVGIDDVGSYLGQNIVLESYITRKEDDYFLFGDFKIHGSDPNINENDRARIEILVDYNSSSKKNEGWLIPDSLQVTEKYIEPVQNEDVVLSTTSTPIAKKVSTTASSPSKSSAQTTKATTVVRVTPTAIKTTSPVSYQQPSVVSSAGNSPNKNNDDYFTSVISLAAGALVMRGKRLKALIRPG